MTENTPVKPSNKKFSNILSESIRRKVPSPFLHAVWDSIRYLDKYKCRKKDLIFILSQLLTATNKRSNNADIYSKIIDDCVSDGAIGLFEEQSGEVSYIMLAQRSRLEEHDWYCIHCHEPGSVIQCKECFFVYHLKCHLEYFNINITINHDDDTDENDDLTDEFIDQIKLCHLCQEKASYSCEITNERLNFFCQKSFLRIKDWLTDTNKQPESYSDATGFKWTEESFQVDKRKEYLFYMPEINKQSMLRKLDLKLYEHPIEYLADLITVIHSIALFYGPESQEAEDSNTTIQDVTEDIKEMRRCEDCYNYSVNREPNWFLQPCKKTHEVVWAKLTGYPYWPAKVMEISEKGVYDVRFFGSYDRGKIGRNQVKKVSVDSNLFRARGLWKQKSSKNLRKAIVQMKTFMELQEKSRVEGFQRIQGVSE